METAILQLFGSVVVVHRCRSISNGQFKSYTWILVDTKCVLHAPSS
jgi:hypothetical protein